MFTLPFDPQVCTLEDKPASRHGPIHVFQNIVIYDSFLRNITIFAIQNTGRVTWLNYAIRVNGNVGLGTPRRCVNVRGIWEWGMAAAVHAERELPSPRYLPPPIHDASCQDATSAAAAATWVIVNECHTCCARLRVCGGNLLLATTGDNRLTVSWKRITNSSTNIAIWRYMYAKICRYGGSWYWRYNISAHV